MQLSLVDCLLVGWAVAIGIYDAMSRRVPNWLLLLVAIPCLLAFLINHGGYRGASGFSSVVGAVAGFAILLPGYMAGKLGAGDVKYASVIGFIVAIRSLPLVLLASALVLGLMSLVVLTEAKLATRVSRNVPAAIALSAGFVAYVFGALDYVG